ncbi:MAG TPA: hypothetical protein V6D17_24615, partial [Candidatus Obscuribacterales bacterium]
MKARLILLPAGLWLTVFMVVPLAILVVFSVGSRDDLGRVALGFSFHNYVRFFTGPYLLALGRSVVLALVTTIVCLVVGTCCALWLAFLVPRNKQGLFMTMFVLPL